MATIQLLGPMLGTAAACGINLYLTVLTIGLGTRFGFIHLSPDLAGLSILANPYVLIVAGIAYAIEFFADKIPWVDSTWDAIHTFIRPVGAVIIGMNGLSGMDPAMEVAALILCGGLALSTHSTKVGIRIGANHSPEPFSNIALSITEDILTVGLCMTVYKHPLLAFSIVLIFLFIFILIFPKIFRLIRFELIAVQKIFKSLLINQEAITDNQVVLFDEVPDRYSSHMVTDDMPFCISSGSGKGVNGGKHCLGFLYLSKKRLFFITRKNFHYRTFDIDLNDVINIKSEHKLFFDKLVLNLGSKTIHFYVFKHSKNRISRILEIIEQHRVDLKNIT